jgi:hypothetical protein
LYTYGKATDSDKQQPAVVRTAKPWESKAPIKSASDELEDVIRGEKND